MDYVTLNDIYEQEMQSAERDPHRGVGFKHYFECYSQETDNGNNPISVKRLQKVAGGEFGRVRIAHKALSQSQSVTTSPSYPKPGWFTIFIDKIKLDSDALWGTLSAEMGKHIETRVHEAESLRLNAEQQLNEADEYIDELRAEHEQLATAQEELNNVEVALERSRSEVKCTNAELLVLQKRVGELELSESQLVQYQMHNQQMKAQLKELQALNTSLRDSHDQLLVDIGQLQGQNALLKGQLSSSLVHRTVHEPPGGTEVEQCEDELWEEPNLYKLLNAKNAETVA